MIDRYIPGRYRAEFAYPEPQRIKTYSEIRIEGLQAYAILRNLYPKRPLREQDHKRELPPSEVEELFSLVHKGLQKYRKFPSQLYLIKDMWFDRTANESPFNDMLLALVQYNPDTFVKTMNAPYNKSTRAASFHLLSLLFSKGENAIERRAKASAIFEEYPQHLILALNDGYPSSEQLMNILHTEVMGLQTQCKPY